MPDSGWIKALKEAGIPFFSVLFVGLAGMSLVWRFLPGLIGEPFAGARNWTEPLAVACLFIIVAQVVWLAIKAPKTMPEWLAARLLAQRYYKLSDRQRGLLDNAYGRGRRSFEVQAYEDRWFEELEELGFIKSVPLMVYAAGMSWPYEVTLPAWKALELVTKRSKVK